MAELQKGVGRDRVPFPHSLCPVRSPVIARRSLQPNKPPSGACCRGASHSTGGPFGGAACLALRPLPSAVQPYLLLPRPFPSYPSPEQYRLTLAMGMHLCHCAPVVLWTALGRLRRTEWPPCTGRGELCCTGSACWPAEPRILETEPSTKKYPQARVGREGGRVCTGCLFVCSVED